MIGSIRVIVKTRFIFIRDERSQTVAFLITRSVSYSLWKSISNEHETILVQWGSLTSLPSVRPLRITLHCERKSLISPHICGLRISSIFEGIQWLGQAKGRLVAQCFGWGFLHRMGWLVPAPVIESATFPPGHTSFPCPAKPPDPSLTAVMIQDLHVNDQENKITSQPPFEARIVIGRLMLWKYFRSPPVLDRKELYRFSIIKRHLPFMTSLPID